MVQPSRTSTPTEVLAGLVERVTFHNDENGFCVVRVKARGQRDLIAVLGHAATISAGEFVQVSGSRINDRTHGVQFKASFLKAAPATTIEGFPPSYRTLAACYAHMGRLDARAILARLHAITPLGSSERSAFCRLVKTTGDGLLVKFSKVTGPLRWAD